MLLLTARRRLVAALGLGAVCIVAYVVVPPKRRRVALQSFLGLQRLSRVILFCFGAASEYGRLDYIAKVDGIERDSGEYKSRKMEVDISVAKRFLQLSIENGVGFLKMSQFLSTQPLPPEVVAVLARAQDQSTPVPFARVSQVFEEDTGLKPEEVFECIEELPRAAASLAQVHFAVTKQGQRVAVKIQYPHLVELILQDLAAMRIIVGLIEWHWPDYGFSWLLPDFERQALCEVDFLQEASNSERLGRMFAGDPRIHVPVICRELSSRRVIVMEWIDGCKINDKASLQRMRVNERDLARTVTSTFASMIHVHGFVHCDPHPGNIFVRKAPASGTGWQLVILDHGMYRQMSVRFRRAYCLFYKSVVLKDRALLRQACVDLGMKSEDETTFSVAFGMGSREERALVKARFGGNEANAFLQRLPRDMLFVMRSINMVRGLNRGLGGTKRDRIRTTGEAAVRGLYLTDAVDAAGLGAVVQLPSQSLTAAGEGAQVVSAVAVGDVTLPSGSLYGLLAAFRPAGPRPRLTYSEALERGVLAFEPTESELMAAARTGKSGWQSAWDAASSECGVFAMRARLALADAALAVALPLIAVSATVRSGLASVGLLPAADSAKEDAEEDKRWGAAPSHDDG